MVQAVSSMPGVARPLSYALLFHLAVAALLLVNVQWQKPPPLVAEQEVIAAVVMDGSVLSARESQRQADQVAERARQRMQDEQQHAEAEESQRAQQQAQVRAQQEIDARHRELAARERIAQEKQAALKAQQEQRAAEERKQREQEKRLAEEEARRNAEMEASRKAQLERERALREDARRRQEEEEQALQERLAMQQSAARERAVKAARDRYVALISQKVSKSWLRPQSWKEGMTCILKVRLTPGGEVVSADVEQCSGGDVAVERSAEAAVFRARPLPVPTDPAIFEETFREFKFRFAPDS